MPDPSLSAALREAYASVPAAQVIHHTLEIWASAFAAPIRVVRGIESLDARLEAGAPRNASEVVTFVAYAFDVVPPDMSSEALPQVAIEIDNVSREILVQIDAAVMAGAKIEVIYREFLSDAALDGPETDPPMALELIMATATKTRIRATAGFPLLMDAKFPRLDYDLESYPGLAR
jgi:hypothetical protein